MNICERWILKRLLKKVEKAGICVSGADPGYNIDLDLSGEVISLVLRHGSNASNVPAGYPFYLGYLSMVYTRPISQLYLDRT